MGTWREDKRTYRQTHRKQTGQNAILIKDKDTKHHRQTAGLPEGHSSSSLPSSEANMNHSGVSCNIRLQVRGTIWENGFPNEATSPVYLGIPPKKDLMPHACVCLP